MPPSSGGMRMLTWNDRQRLRPVVAVTGFIRLLPWRLVPAEVREIREMRAYLRGAGNDTPRAEVEQRVCGFYDKMLASAIWACPLT
jgi:hypothetical protein